MTRRCPNIHPDDCAVRKLVACVRKGAFPACRPVSELVFRLAGRPVSGTRRSNNSNLVRSTMQLFIKAGMV